MRFFRYFLIVLLYFLFSVSYGKVKICTTTSLIQNLVSEIGGDFVEIENLMGPGVDPHLYKATATDVNKLRSADLIFYNGLHLEGRMVDIFLGLAEQGKRAFAVTEGIEKELLISLGENAGYDPHVWFDPRLWAQCGRKVLSELKKFDAQNGDFYQRKADDYIASLEKLYEWGKGYGASLPAGTRILITSHDAYNYFGRAFDFQVIGVQGISTVSEAGLADIVSTIDFIKTRKIKAIFIESSVSPAAIERIGKDSGAKIGGKLFSDSLGKPGEIQDSYDVGNYIGMFKYNMTTIVENLK
ncbi:MAG: ABC transporter substrate-binding protein [Verrucomicrobia bacterium]|nr:MAG: ABC transporter substrate-binding protein [Verrucomicrobiota bacterium]